MNGVSNHSSLRSILDAPLSKAFMSGTHRVVSLEETLARFRPLAGAMGITRIGNITGLDHIGIPVAIAVQPKSKSVAVSQGKGVTLPHALVSAFMEAAETLHAENALPEAHYSSAREMASLSCIDDLASLRSCDTRLDPRTILPWTEGFDLVRREPCWIPTELVHTDYISPPHKGAGHFLASTNGLASGNHRLEAISAAICELIERDALACWEARYIRQRAACLIDLATIQDSQCRDLLDRYEHAGFIVRIWDITSDIGVPAFACDIRSQSGSSAGLDRRFRGAGCHPSRIVALLRALTEAAQVRLTHIVGIRNDIFAEAYDEALNSKAGGLLLDALAKSVMPRSFCDIPTFESDDVSADVHWLLARLSSAGCRRIVAIDLTRPALDIPVIRVIAPDLEAYHAHPGYRSGPRARQAADLA